MKKTALIDPKLKDWEEPQAVSHPDFDFKSDVIIKWSHLKMGAKLGSGAFGDVKAAEFRGTPVAVKLLHSSDTAQAFFQEASLLCSLRHPNIVSCLGVCVTEPNLAIVMELMSGNLTQIVRNGPVPLPQFLSLAIPITRGILFLHHRTPKVIHRDIKPENILIDASGIPKLGDFGVSKESLETMTQTKIGTPIYAAPELLNAEAYGTAIDIYSLAMVFYAMATGVTPFSDLGTGAKKLNPMQIMMKVAVNRERPIIPASVPPKLAAIIRDCWEHLPKKRLTAEQLLGRLLELKEPESAGTILAKTSDLSSAASDATVPILESKTTVPIAVDYGSLTTVADFDWMDEGEAKNSKSDDASKNGSKDSINRSVSTNADHTLMTSTDASSNTIAIEDATPSQIFRNSRVTRSKNAKVTALNSQQTKPQQSESAKSAASAKTGQTAALASLSVNNDLFDDSGSGRSTRSKTKQVKATAARGALAGASIIDSEGGSQTSVESSSIDYTVPMEVGTRGRKRKADSETPTADLDDDTSLAAHKRMVYQLEVEEGKRRPEWYA